MPTSPQSSLIRTLQGTRGCLARLPGRFTVRHTRKALCSTACACLIAPFAPFPAAAQDSGDPRIDPDIGRDVAHWPHPRPFDHLHMRLELDIPDMNVPQLTGHETLTITPIGQNRASLQLDAQRMAIYGVSIAGRPQPFIHDGQHLNILFNEPIKLGQTVDIAIDYGLQYPNNNGVGLTWTPGKPDGENDTARAPQIHTQGQPESSRLWFPCHDFPNERLTTELLVTLPDGFDTCSNGRLASMNAAPDGRVTWHWMQDQPIANYLVVLVVGRFDIVDLGNVSLGSADGQSRSIPVKVYTTAGTADHVRSTFARTPQMIEHFSRLFGEPFPWDKYDQLMVRRFAAGAMENASATTFSSFYADATRDQAEEVIAHELVHQWFGDLLTYKSWEHTWLSEGWASLGEALWAEAAADEGRSRRAYLRTIGGFLARQRSGNRAYAPLFPAMASNRYASPDNVFMKTDNVYSKGALVLHMLRERLGDDVFFAGVRLYIQRFKFKEVETDDFRRCLEEASGESLQRFFDQWAARPGLPKLAVTIDWDGSARRLRVRAEQQQRIDIHNPAYAFELPLVAKFQGRPSETVFLVMDSRTAEDSFQLAEAPTDVLVDPAMTVATATEVAKSLGQPPEPAPPEPDATPDAEPEPSESPAGAVHAGEGH